MNEELKSCPFCGCHDRRVSVRKETVRGSIQEQNCSTRKSSEISGTQESRKKKSKELLTRASTALGRAGALDLAQEIEDYLYKTR